MSDINIFITSDLTSSERRISPQWTLDYFKQKLELITGVEPKNQLLQYFPNKYSNEFIQLSTPTTYSKQQDQETNLDQLGLKEYSRIHVIDMDPNSTTNQITSTISPSSVTDGATPDYYQMPEEEYRKRNNTVLQWKQEQKLGRFDPEYELLQKHIAEENAAKLATIHINDRCRVINIEGERRGTVRFVGTIDHLDGGKQDWVGIEFDEPVGKNSGDIDGVQLFVCRPNHGSFVKPKQVEVGDFPELDPFAEDDDSDEEL
ncbi:Ubiquitin-like domain family protein [Candida parapsilosis]|uniref:CAP-Gly domain-containing protein n=2 Tax=Candida parapsilosis TaxID=5480 RepID=G8BBP9_CANPC|nr:uncharacterized protein CPAR2_801160 [Candida parapsilosis]KAF6051465.1 Ubiquitin-like domain family protein [Candida parapsilosis]KAF6053038.1 Ubiquitin-like domain family protein [Candida parapsilosis]KAF6053267.1 Ubiquitin-like domain family protein [Candida parapsilosis]KAF6064816.1 Ubiquitin-like domain family protein [Candida parapsilosis]KAI5902195.1 Cell polarity protein alp11 [Candida parapsilosis]